MRHVRFKATFYQPKIGAVLDKIIVGKKKKILIINAGQFGYKAGYYYYTKYLKDDFDISFLCFDAGLKKVVIEDVDISYVSPNGNIIKRQLRWFREVLKTIRSSDKNTVIFMSHFKLCFIIALFFPHSKLVLDIRTGSVNKKPIVNWIQNKQLLFESYFFKNITILSKGLINHLGIKKDKCHWLPLGADVISNASKKTSDLNLVYVGVINNRNIHQTVLGVKLFLEKYDYPPQKISYDIIGYGNEEEEKLLWTTIRSNNLESIVHFHGRKDHSELKEYFDKCNIGVSYVPITAYYDYQPPTKTFEYILSGLYCIATGTKEHLRVINNDNGVICEDNFSSFANSLGKLMVTKLPAYSTIRQSLSGNLWENIVKNNLSKYLQRI